MIIKDAQEYLGVSTVSKAFLTAIGMVKEQNEMILKLQRELTQERQRSLCMSAGIADFEASMARLFTLK
ncbi:hypothetical protein CKS_5636 [Pantoea stewartii subsp. stewartii DC283]|uniref:Uncharacterized protein n=1 Tax=Pantoea stewartii subsp. stewartii DC283 TaxID=660596 RepID=H3RM36_PANSE|nr:hypothetical protein CKS_5636 [Pantoea stewartii subsp. stewartii DC283]